MMRHPNNRTLGDICDEVGGIIRTGPFGSQLHQSDYKDDGLPVIMPKDIINGKVETESIARIGEADEIRLKEHKLRKGDIVFARRGDLGRCALIGERENGWLCGTGSLRVSVGNTVIDPTYLFYYFSHDNIISWIKSRAIGATLPNLNTSIIRDIPISYPSLPIQRKIADVLSAYDDLIEVNTRRIRILEQMAQSVYREWFGKVEEGALPEGWKIQTMQEVADVIDCLHTKKPSHVENGIGILLQLNNIGENGKLDLTKKFLLSKEDYELWTSRIEASPGDCVVTNVGRVAAVAQIPAGVKAALGRNMTGIVQNLLRRLI